MFCPNCGAPNTDASTTCQKCGFSLKGSGASKFKGTMLMMNANPAELTGDPLGGAVAAPAPGPESPAKSDGGGELGRTAVGGGGFEVPRPKVSTRSRLHGTMIGVAPPSAGAVVPPSADVNASVGNSPSEGPASLGSEGTPETQASSASEPDSAGPAPQSRRPKTDPMPSKLGSTQVITAELSAASPPEAERTQPSAAPPPRSTDPAPLSNGLDGDTPLPQPPGTDRRPIAETKESESRAPFFIALGLIVLAAAGLAAYRFLL